MPSTLKLFISKTQGTGLLLGHIYPLAHKWSSELMVTSQNLNRHACWNTIMLECSTLWWLKSFDFCDDYSPFELCDGYSPSSSLTVTILWVVMITVLWVVMVTVLRVVWWLQYSNGYSPLSCVITVLWVLRWIQPFELWWLQSLLTWRIQSFEFHGGYSPFSSMIVTVCWALYWLHSFEFYDAYFSLNSVMTTVLSVCDSYSSLSCQLVTDMWVLWWLQSFDLVVATVLCIQWLLQSFEFWDGHS